METLINKIKYKNMDDFKLISLIWAMCMGALTFCDVMLAVINFQSDHIGVGAFAIVAAIICFICMLFHIKNMLSDD